MMNLTGALILTSQDGSTFDLNSCADTIYISDTGWGLSPFHRITERGPLQDGETDIGFRLDPRGITLAFMIRADGPIDYWTARQALLDVFKPATDPMTLTFTRGTFSRAIDVHTSEIGGLTLNFDDGSILTSGEYAHSVIVPLVARDPTWYAPDIVTDSYQLLTVISGMDVPTPVPTPIGGTLPILIVRNITYPGTWETYPIITIVGPLINPIIENLTIGTILDFTGHTLLAGQFLTINLAYGAKTVVDGSGANRIDWLSTDSDLVTWRIAHAQRGARVNQIRVTGTGASAATLVTIQYYNRYIGV